MWHFLSLESSTYHNHIYFSPIMPLVLFPSPSCHLFSLAECSTRRAWRSSSTVFCGMVHDSGSHVPPSSPSVAVCSCLFQRLWWGDSSVHVEWPGQDCSSSFVFSALSLVPGTQLVFLEWCILTLFPHLIGGLDVKTVTFRNSKMKVPILM